MFNSLRKRMGSIAESVIMHVGSAIDTLIDTIDIYGISILAFMLVIAGYAILVAWVDWRIALAVFLIHWRINIGMRAK